LHNKLWSKNDKHCNELLHKNSNMDLKMHVYSVPLRSPFAFPCAPWKFEVGERFWPQIRSRGTAFPRILLHFNHWIWAQKHFANAHNIRYVNVIRPTVFTGQKTQQTVLKENLQKTN